jgi:hypothetical protein
MDPEMKELLAREFKLRGSWLVFHKEKNPDSTLGSLREILDELISQVIQARGLKGGPEARVQALERLMKGVKGLA